MAVALRRHFQLDIGNVSYLADGAVYLSRRFPQKKGQNMASSWGKNKEGKITHLKAAAVFSGWF